MQKIVQIVRVMEERLEQIESKTVVQDLQALLDADQEISQRSTSGTPKPRDESLAETVGFTRTGVGTKIHKNLPPTMRRILTRIQSAPRHRASTYAVAPPTNVNSKAPTDVSVRSSALLSTRVLQSDEKRLDRIKTLFCTETP